MAEALDTRWSAWFDGMTLTVVVSSDHRAQTLLEGDVRDQAALYGLLARIRDLNLSLLSVHRLDKPNHEYSDITNRPRGEGG